MDNGEILVDGAVLNNFPSDVMRELHRGFVVGSDVSRAREGLKADDFINPPGFLRWVWQNGFSAAPPIAGLLMRSATVSINPNAGRDKVDILISPELTGVELRDWETYDNVVEAGYTAAIKALKDSDLQSLCCSAESSPAPIISSVRS